MIDILVKCKRLSVKLCTPKVLKLPLSYSRMKFLPHILIEELLLEKINKIKHLIYNINAHGLEY